MSKVSSINVMGANLMGIIIVSALSLFIVLTIWETIVDACKTTEIKPKKKCRFCGKVYDATEEHSCN